jgi:Transposase DDE domain
MIAGFDEFCLHMYVLIDDLWPGILPPGSRPGPAPRPSDPELVTMLLVGECCGWDIETEFLAHWRPHRDLFPQLPERSRLNRRRRALAPAINQVRRCVLTQCDFAWDRQCVIDSLPIPVLQWQHVPHAGSRSDWLAADASYGRVPSKGQAIFGYKLHLLVTANGLIRDFELAPAWHTDIVAGAELLAEQHDLVVLGDKGYVGAAVAAHLVTTRAVTLLAPPRANQRRQWPHALRRSVLRLRQIIETVNDQLTEQFQIQRNHAYSFWGLCARLYTKLTAHTLCMYLNRITGAAEPLHIKHWVLDN